MLVLVCGSLAVAGPFKGTIEYEIRVTGEGGSQAASAMPTRAVVELGKGVTVLELQGGMAPTGRFVVDTKTGTTTFVRDDFRTRAVLPPRSEVVGEVEWMAGEEVIQGYECRQYRAMTAGRAGPQTSFVWATPELKMASTTFGSVPTVLLVAKGSAPLKVVAEQGTYTLEMEAVDVSRRKPSKERMAVPTEYTEISFQ